MVQTPKMNATEEGARTLDHKVKSLALYQLSYSGPLLGNPSLGESSMIWEGVTYVHTLFLHVYDHKFQ